MTEQSSATVVMDDDFSPAFYQERLLVDAEMRGFSSHQAKWLVFFKWLHEKRNIENSVREG